MFQKDYDERVYAGVLGKVIGVYAGKPFEGWSYEKILQSRASGRKRAPAQKSA